MIHDYNNTAVVMLISPLLWIKPQVLIDITVGSLCLMFGKSLLAKKSDVQAMIKCLLFCSYVFGIDSIDKY